MIKVNDFKQFINIFLLMIWIEWRVLRRSVSILKSFLSTDCLFFRLQGFGQLAQTIFYFIFPTIIFNSACSEISFSAIISSSRNLASKMWPCPQRS